MPVSWISSITKYKSIIVRLKRYIALKNMHKYHYFIVRNTETNWFLHAACIWLLNTLILLWVVCLRHFYTKISLFLFFYWKRNQIFGAPFYTGACDIYPTCNPPVSASCQFNSIQKSQCTMCHIKRPCWQVQAKGK